MTLLSRPYGAPSLRERDRSGYPVFDTPRQLVMAGVSRYGGTVGKHHEGAVPSARPPPLRSRRRRRRIDMALRLGSVYLR